MFGHRFFGPRFFGPRYFGSRARGRPPGSVSPARGRSWRPRIVRSLAQADVSIEGTCVVRVWLQEIPELSPLPAMVDALTAIAHAPRVFASIAEGQSTMEASAAARWYDHLRAVVLPEDEELWVLW